MSTRTLVLFLLAVTSGCTMLGPMPATTQISAVPVSRPGAEVQAAIVPAFYLSDATRAPDRDDTRATHQLAALVEPDRWLGTKGLVLGLRTWGEGGDSPVEPMIGVRRKLHEHFAIAAIAFGTHARGEERDAFYEARRAGGELALDATLVSLTSWLAIHVQAAVSATYLDATGSYCVTSSGFGTDCEADSRRVDGAVEGIYTAATAGASIDLARRPHGVIHGVRAGVVLATGAMPKLRDGIQEASDQRYRSFGLHLTIGFGDGR